MIALPADTNAPYATCQMQDCQMASQVASLSVDKDIYMEECLLCVAIPENCSISSLKICR